MKNILVVPAWYDMSDPLVGTFFHEYCNSMSSQCNVTLLDFTHYSFSDTFKRNNKEDKTKGKKYNVLRVDYYNPFPGKWFGLSAYFQRKLATLKTIKLVEEYSKLNGKFDLVHIQSVCNNLTATISVAIANKLDIPYLVTEHYTGFKEAGETMFIPFTTFKEIKNIVQHASVRIGVSSFASRFCEEVFDCSFDTVYNIISSDFISTPIISDQPKPFNFICIGAFKPRKGQQYLIKAFAEIINECENISLTFVGSGSDKDNAISLAESLGVSNKIKVVSNVSSQEFIQLLDASSVLVSASDKELFGLTIVEAFFRGKPAISTKSGGPEDLINANNGLLCEFADVETMAKQMKYIYNNYTSYNSENIRNQAISRFSEQAIVPIMMSKYQFVLNNFKKKKANV